MKRTEEQMPYYSKEDQLRNMFKRKLKIQEENQKGNGQTDEQVNNNNIQINTLLNNPQPPIILQPPPASQTHYISINKLLKQAYQTRLSRMNIQ